jgi:pimeloyl-ACP methyl ester carboxylesterase
MPPLWSRLAERRDQGVLGDSLVLTGARDERFVEVGTRLGRCLGGRSETVAGAGHAAHLEAPETTTALVRAALDDAAP